jgi:Zn-dependent metalloprotease
MFSKKVFQVITAGSLAMAASHCADDSAVSIVRTQSQVLSHPLLANAFANLTIDEAVQRSAASHNADARLSFKAQSGALGLAGEEITSYDVEINSVPFCDQILKGYQSSSSKKIYLVGHIPDVSGYELETAELHSDRIIGLIAAENSGKTVQAEDSSECLVATNDLKIRNVLKVFWRADGHLFVSYADNNVVYSTIDQSFHVTGTAKIFPNNIYDTGVKSFTLSDLTTANKLASSHFDVVVPAAYSEAEGSGNVFSFDVDSSEFEQTSAFTNATRTAEWFESLGYLNFGKTAIQLKVHAEQENNAFYTPEVGTKAPTISIGNSDGIVLQNLATDADVVGHEFGHHIVYQTVRTVEKDSEALVLHEGLADFFTFARTGNSCLGESICPETSHICSVPTECLRTADNNYKYGDDDLPVDAHLRSQFISGMLWDMKNEDEVGNDMSKLVLKAIDLLVTDSGYRHLVLGLLAVDESKYDSQYCEVILARAKTRGLTKYLSDVTCGQTLPDIDSTSTATTTTTAKSDSGSSKKKFCAVQEGTTTPLGSLAIFLFMLVPPTFVAMRAKRQGR